MAPLIPYADVKIYGGLDPDGEEYKGARLTSIGNPADVTLYMLNADKNKWNPVDRLTGAKVTETPVGLLIEGTSEELIHTVGMTQANAVVRWEVTPRECKNCG